jgi:hypothetical protein
MENKEKVVDIITQTHKTPFEQADEIDSMYKKEMQMYAEFCIYCERKDMPLLLVEDWYKHYR